MTTGKPPFMIEPDSEWLTGQFLVAMPSLPDPRFARAVIYICSHGPEGAMGLIVNRLFAEASFGMLLEQVGIDASPETPQLPVHFGGPVETGRGFVLHSADYMREGSVPIRNNIALTATVEMLQAIADGGGPEKLLMALGYSGWGAGQLDAEMKANSWLTVPASEDLLFAPDTESKWDSALTVIGINPALLSEKAGHA